MKTLLIYGAIGFVMVSIDMIVFLMGDTLDKAQYTSPLDVIVLILFFIDIPFMTLSSLCSLVVAALWNLAVQPSFSGDPALLHISPFQAGLLHMTLDICIYIVLAALFHGFIYIPLRGVIWYLMSIKAHR